LSISIASNIIKPQQLSMLILVKSQQANVQWIKKMRSKFHCYNSQSGKILKSSEHMSIPGKPVPVAAPGLALVLVHHASCPAVLGQICPAISAEVLVTGPTGPMDFTRIWCKRSWQLGICQRKNVGFLGKTIFRTVFQISTDVLMIWHDLTIFGYQVYHDLRRFIMIYGVSI
jgi:hypothetical protein